MFEESKPGLWRHSALKDIGWVNTVFVQVFLQESRYGFKLLGSSFLLGSVLTLSLGPVWVVPCRSYRQDQPGCVTRPG